MIRSHNIHKIFQYPIVLIAVIILLSVPVPLHAQTPVEKHGALRIEGNTFVDKNDEVVSLAGISLFWSNTGWGGEKYYNADAVAYIKTWNAAIIRASMGIDASGGYLSDVSNKDRVKTVVDAAIDEGLYVLIDWHTHHAEDYPGEAVDFFEEMATLYGHTDNVIYEIYNEPLPVSWSDIVKPYADTVIRAIRAIDTNNIIVVGTPFWSQYVDEASLDPLDEYKNIAYAAHFYAGTHSATERGRITTALNNGIAVMITEWGGVEASGDGDVSYGNLNVWMNFIKQNHLSHCNWALNDKDEGASFLIPGSDPYGGWDDEDLTESGWYTREIILDWHTDTVYNAPPIPGAEPEPEALSLKERDRFTIFPNPFSDVIYIDFPENESVYRIEFIDLNGNIITGYSANDSKHKPLALEITGYEIPPVCYVRITTKYNVYTTLLFHKN